MTPAPIFVIGVGVGLLTASVLISIPTNRDKADYNCARTLGVETKEHAICVWEHLHKDNQTMTPAPTPP